MGGVLDESFQQIDNLGRPRAPVGIDGRGMGQPSVDLHVNRGNAIHVPHHLGEARGRGTDAVAGEIRAEVRRRSHPKREKTTCLVERELGLCAIVPPVRIGHERLATSTHPAHWSTQRLGRDQHEPLLGKCPELHTETTPDVVRDDAQPVLSDPEHGPSEKLAQEMHALAGGVQGVPAASASARGTRILVEVTDRATRLERADHDSVIDDLDGHPRRRGVERRVDRRPVASLPFDATSLADRDPRAGG